VLTVGVITAPPVLAGTTSVAAQSWTADNGNGTYSNPLFYEEFEDPDVIRVGEDYYLAGTTMHMNPALIVLHSKDLVNWELASYCMDRLDLGPAFHLEDGNIYGRGIWAPCIRHHDGIFYVFSNVNGVGCQVFRSKPPNGPWTHNQLPGMHDLSVLFDDGKIYAIYGATRPTIVELNKDLTEIVPNSRRQMNAPGMGEGHHLYKINGKYYDVSAIPGAHTDQVVARADSIYGPWQVERMVQSESLGVPTQNSVRGGRGGNPTFTITPSNPNSGGGLTLHQGGIVDTPSGEWWSIIMQDHGSIGRMVALVPVTWDNNFPIIGLPGNLRKAPNTWIKPNTGHTQDPKPLFVHSDNFDSAEINPVWQWNHVPDDTKWSLTERSGVLRLHSLPASDFWMARNSLTQRPMGPESIATVELDASGLAVGDTAGVALLNVPYAWIGLVKTAEGVTLQTFDQTSSKTTKAPASPTHVWLRVACNFDTEKAAFGWSADGKEFTSLGDPFTMAFQLITFQGARLALFNYNTGGEPGGYADFDNFTVDEPRARGIERMIPVGKTITLTSGADGSFLAADTQNNTLVNVVADPNNAGGQDVKFQVVDLGKGRVALKAANGRFVSAAGDGVSLKDLAGKTPGDPESFQWVNLMRGDTMLMSLTNHRYLATEPNEPGPVTASAAGPHPDRKDGACFTWREVPPSSPALPVARMQAANRPSEGSLRLAAKDLFDMGVGINDRIADRVADHRLLLTQFGIVTPENCMKPAKVQAAEGRWDFAQADVFVDFATKNGLKVVGHCLVWAKDDRTPAWFYRDGEKPASRVLLLERMRRHIETEVTRYRGRIAEWDVVNEALDDGAEYLRTSGWSRECGEEFIAKAFEYAHAADPAAMLIYNDYNNELPAKREKQIRLVRSLLDKKVPIHAVGLQGHYEIDRVPFKEIEDTLIAMRQLGVKVVISELDIDVIPRGKWWAEGGKYREELSRLDPYRDGCPLEVQKRQADQYAQLFGIFRRYSDVIARVSFWDLHDGQSWLNGFPWRRINHPLLFDRQGQPKPAFAAVISALRQP
jgi:GH35 family endo-1,4-beta-xylanase/beta-xylosidase